MFNFLEDVKLTKEIEKKRKKIYGEELRLQIEQNKKRKMEEKIKSRQESLRNLKLLQSSQLDNNNTLNNGFKFEDNFNNNYQRLKTSIDNHLINYKLNDNFLSLTNKYNSFNNIYFDINKNIRKKPELNLTDKNLNKFNSYFKNNYDDNQKNNNFIENGIYIMKKSPSSLIYNKPLLKNNSNAFNNSYPQNDDLNNVNNDNNNNILFSNNYLNNNNTNNNNLMAEINMQFLFRDFVEQQIKTINEYENNIEDIFFVQYKNRNYNSINSLLENEKNQAMESIKNEQNKLKNILGFFPMENNYNYKIQQLFNKILNKKVITYSSIKEMDNLALNAFINKDNDFPQLLKYKSKYEDENIEDSPNFQQLNINSQNTLRGYSKLVKINENDNKDDANSKGNNNFLESWRDQLEKEISENNENNNSNESAILNNTNMNNINNMNNTSINNFDNNKNENENDDNIKEKLKVFPVYQNFKNAQNIDIKNIKYNHNPDILNQNKTNNINELNYGKRNKSSKNMINPKTINSNNLTEYEKIYNSQKNDNININMNQNIEKDNYKNENINNIVYKKNLKKNLNKKGKSSFSFKKTEPAFIQNAKRGLSYSQSTHFLDNMNYLVLNKDEIKNKENQNNNMKNLEELGNSKISQKLKSSSISSESEKTNN